MTTCVLPLVDAVADAEQVSPPTVQVTVCAAQSAGGGGGTAQLPVWKVNEPDSQRNVAVPVSGGVLSDNVPVVMPLNACGAVAEQVFPLTVQETVCVAQSCVGAGVGPGVPDAVSGTQVIVVDLSKTAMPDMP